MHKCLDCGSDLKHVKSDDDYKDFSGCSEGVSPTERRADWYGCKTCGEHFISLDGDDLDYA